MTAAPLMVVVWAIASVLRPGYNQLTQKGSELSTGQNSIVMNLDFALTGVLIMAFALGLARNIIGSKLSKIGATLLLIAGMCEVVVAGFPCDPGCPAAIGSFSQNVHLGIALVFFSSIAFAPLFVGIGLGGDQFWKPYGPYTTASGIASVVLGTAFSVAVLSSFPLVGLLERVFLSFPFLWIELMAIHMRKQHFPTLDSEMNGHRVILGSTRSCSLSR